MDRSTARLCSKYLSYGLPFLYLLTSIAFYLHTYDSAQVKITIVQMLGTSLIGVWYLKLICEGDVPLKRFAPVAIPLIASLASGLLSFSHATYRGPSLDECLRRVFYIHFALIALTEINTRERLTRMMRYLLIATAISVIYGAIGVFDKRFFPIQSFSTGIDPFIWRQAFGGRIFSTFGNPNFFGNFLVIVTPITLALMLKRHKEKLGQVLVFVMASIALSALLWKVNDLARALHLQGNEDPLFFILIGGFMLWAAIRFSFLGLLFFLITYCNVVTESKGAWVGYAVSMVTFFLLILFLFSQFQSEKLRRTLLMGTLVTLLISALGVGFMSRQRPDSIRFRICTWVSTFEMGVMHPLIGNGIGSFKVLYPAFRRPQIFHIETKHNTETDHAEDEYWEVFQDEGLIGFGIFIWVITTFSLMGVRSLRRFTEGLSTKDMASGKRKFSDDPRAFYMLGFLSAFWGMLIHNFMDVSLRFVSSGIFLWLLAGLIGALTIHDPLREKEEDLANAEKAEGNQTPVVPEIVLSGLRLATIGLFCWVAWRVLVQFQDTQGPFPDPFGEQLLWLIAWVSVLGTIALCLWVFFKVGRSLRLAHGFLVFCAMIYPLFTFWGYFMADVHHNRGIFFSKQGNWDQALDNYHQVVQLNPNYIMAYYFMGNVYTDRWHEGDLQRAMTEYGHAWQIAPNYVQSHHQSGLVYLKKGADDKAASDRLRSMGRAAEADALLLDVEKDWKQALAYFQKYHDIDPVFEPNYARMAWVDMQLAELARARGNNALVDQYLDRAELAYKESLGAWVCGAPENDVMHERWDQNHRHWSEEIFENLGNVRFTRGRFGQALRAFKMALWVDQTNVRAWKNLALTYGRLGDQRAATQTWFHVRELAPTDPDVQKVFGQRRPGA
jgi:tetratricopeptide (TPR) repeat protein